MYVRFAAPFDVGAAPDTQIRRMARSPGVIGTSEKSTAVFDEARSDDVALKVTALPSRFEGVRVAWTEIVVSVVEPFRTETPSSTDDVGSSTSAVAPAEPDGSGWGFTETALMATRALGRRAVVVMAA